MLSHAAALLLIILVMNRLPETPPAATAAEATPQNIVWIVEAGAGGGGGGGGSRRPEVPRTAQLPGRDKVTVPVVSAPAPAPKPVPTPQVALDIPAVTTASGVVELPGVIAELTMPSTTSRGSGSGEGAGTGLGDGIGSGRGDGLGQGFDGGTGGGIREPGNGVSMPRLIHEVRPNYTGEALRAKLQGMVTIEAVVLPDGTVGPVQVLRSLDSRFGLDQEALRTVKQWRFAPGMLKGQPVPVRVAVEMTFTLR
jgi:protein TonB